MLSAIKEEQHAVDCVLKGDVDQYVLDGTDGVLKIPQTLLERIERLPHQVRGGIKGVPSAELKEVLSLLPTSTSGVDVCLILKGYDSCLSLCLCARMFSS